MDVLGPGGLLFLAKVYHAGQLLTVIRPVQLQLRKEVGLVLQADDLPRHQVRVDVLPEPLDVYDVLLAGRRVATWTSKDCCLSDKQMGRERDKLNLSALYPLLMMLAPTPVVKLGWCSYFNQQLFSNLSENILKSYLILITF